MSSESRNLHFQHETRRVQTPVPGRLVDIQPVAEATGSIWIVLNDAGDLYRLNLTAQTATHLFRLPSVPDAPLDLSTFVTLHLSPDGQMAAIVNTYGQFGLVVDLKTGQSTMPLIRHDYDVETSVFPIAFFIHKEKLLLVHATDWNRLDISDPRTGKLLTVRDTPEVVSGQPNPPHYLDYFHCGLLISPDQKWIAENGWVWHPVDVITVWNLIEWIEVNVWESEDGPTRRDIPGADYWDRPMWWVNEKTLAVWGESEENQEPQPVVTIYDVETNQLQRKFFGPQSDFASYFVHQQLDITTLPIAGRMLYMIFDQYLFSLSQEHGTQVWEVETGEKLHQEGGFRPVRYHRGAKQFLTIVDNGTFQLSSLVEN